MTEEAPTTVGIREYTTEEYQGLLKKLEEVYSDPTYKHKLVVLPPTTTKLAILRDNCDGYGCPELPEHECGETLMVSTDVKGVEAAKELYELHAGEAHLEIVETKPYGWLPRQIVEAETCITVATGEAHETDQWEWLDCNDHPEVATKVTWNWQVASVQSLFFLENRADAMEAHQQVVKLLSSAIKEIVSRGDAPTNGPDMGEALADVEGLPEFE